MLHDRKEPTGALVRPYAVTGGRTRPRVEVSIEALVETTQRGRLEYLRISQEEQVIAGLCDGRLQSLAEISARAHMALGVARVLVADMAHQGLVTIHEPVSFDDEMVGTELLERVLSGLRRL